MKPAYKSPRENNVNPNNRKKYQGAKHMKSSYKRKQREELMKKLESDTNWNTLFLNPNAVMAAIAKKFAVKKADILDQAEENLAVRMALAETQIIKDTKEELAASGVDVLVFDNTTRKECVRSRKIIIVKNLPFEVTREKLNELFSYYGFVAQVILPSTKAIAIVEFESNQHAYNAFRNLSYYIYKNEPLYLEWAPDGLLNAGST